MNRRAKLRVAAAALVVGAAGGVAGAAAPAAANRLLVVAQAMVAPTGMNDAQNPMPMDERMNRRFPQPVRVGDLIGLPVLDDDDSTLGFVRQVVRTPQGKLELVVSYSRWFGWFGRPVVVPLAAVAILGRQLASLDMPPSEYAAAPTWRQTTETALPGDASVRVALGRR